ncbi:MAG TPA: DEAD/DEAH box helicase [Nitriliruptoraceae bacterium]|nr:DEAD/DEAH box helicase [Nitriliruptoraceae bacterium]
MTSVGDHRALHLTFVPDDTTPAAGAFAAWGCDQLRDHLDVLGLPAGEAGDIDHALGSAPARLLPLVATLRRLAEMPTADAWPQWSRPSDTVLAWSLAAKFALELVTEGRLLPIFVATTAPDTAIAHWIAVAASDGRREALADMLPPAAHALIVDDRPLPALPAVDAFLDAVADACGRAGHRPVPKPNRRRSARPFIELATEALVGRDPVVAPLRRPSDDLAADVVDWLQPARGDLARADLRLAVRLVPPIIPDDQDDRPLVTTDEPWRLDLLLQSVRNPEDVVAAAPVWDGTATELGGQALAGAQAILVRGLVDAAAVFSPLDRALGERRPDHVELTSAEAAALLGDGITELTEAGIGVLVPPELREVHGQRLRVRLRIGQTTPVSGRLDSTGFLDQRSLVGFVHEAALGDDALSEQEFADVMQLQRSLVRWRGRWVRIDRDEASRVDDAVGTTGTMELTEAVAAALAGQAHRDDEDIDVIAVGDVADLVARLQTVPPPAQARIVAIDGTLRDYQQRGVAWMQQMADMGAGGVLADEMGLGKTIMAIALLTSRDQDRPHLVVTPTSVVGNWERELKRFAPAVPVIRHHGPDRPVSPRQIPPAHVVLTSYALLRRDQSLLSSVDWDVVIFDEAQQIKNAGSQGAKAARLLPARARFALTGTPIENRLGELWAILDLTNPGMLGPQRRFTRRYAVPIERWRDQEAAARLRRLIAPFVIRRRKDDPDVAVDLPAKQELTVTTTLTREQAQLYQRTIDEAFESGLGATAFERRGRILALLTKLKQICNHPRHFLRDGGPLVGRSGKLDRATGLLEEVVANGDHALVFTQFREMGDLLETHLGEQLDLPSVPFLHGGTPMAKREEMVADFQDRPDAPPIMLVSLRAGGTGLNLTRATHVMHYDRWWNPAVEDQATDRVHRIGQTRSVTVHRLVTAGTVEERINEVLERKRAIADAVVGESEAWITELGDDDVRELVSLASDAYDDEEEAA